MQVHCCVPCSSQHFETISKVTCGQGFRSVSYLTTLWAGMRGGGNTRRNQQQPPLLRRAAVAGVVAGPGAPPRRAPCRRGHVGAPQGRRALGGVASPVRRQPGVRGAVQSVRARARCVRLHGALPCRRGPVVARPVGGHGSPAQQDDLCTAPYCGGLQESQADRAPEADRVPAAKGAPDSKRSPEGTAVKVVPWWAWASGGLRRAYVAQAPLMVLHIRMKPMFGSPVESKLEHNTQSLVRSHMILRQSRRAAVATEHVRREHCYGRLLTVKCVEWAMLVIHDQSLCGRSTAPRQFIAWVQHGLKCAAMRCRHKVSLIRIAQEQSVSQFGFNLQIRCHVWGFEWTVDHVSPPYNRIDESRCCPAADLVTMNHHIRAMTQPPFRNDMPMVPNSSHMCRASQTL